MNLLFPSLHDLLLLLLSKHIQCLMWLGFSHPSGQWREFQNCSKVWMHHVAHKEKSLAEGACEPRTGPKGDSCSQESQRRLLDFGSAESRVKICWESDHWFPAPVEGETPVVTLLKVSYSRQQGVSKLQLTDTSTLSQLLYLTHPWDRD